VPMDSCLILFSILVMHAKYPFVSSVFRELPHVLLAIQAAQQHPAIALLYLLLASILEGIAALTATTLA